MSIWTISTSRAHEASATRHLGIRIQDGVLTYEDAASHLSETLGDIDLSLAWPSISRSFAATGQFDWRGERVDGSISASDFVAALSGDRSGVKRGWRARR